MPTDYIKMVCYYLGELLGSSWSCHISNSGLNDRTFSGNKRLSQVSFSRPNINESMLLSFKVTKDSGNPAETRGQLVFVSVLKVVKEYAFV